MQKLVILAFVVIFMSACAHKQNGSDAEQKKVTAQTSDVPVAKDITSFHLSDPEGPKVVDEELENIPTEVNPMVDKWVEYFQGKGRHHMERYLSRSTRYEKLMKKVLRDNGVPEDIFYIALIESGFSSQAISNASAVGYWQFIRGTGKRYGLEINQMVDERRDPVFATQAAAEYFRGLYSVFGSWYLAMASYNVGENRVKKEVMAHYTRDFWELARKKRFPKETINYIPKFIAAKMIAKDPAKYGFDGIDYMPAIEFDSVVLSKPVNLRTMADKMNYNYEDFKALNPKYKCEIAPLKGAQFELRIPVGQRDLALSAANESVVEKAEFIADHGDTQSYKIHKGDSLHTIARRFRTSVAYLRDLNDIPKGKRLKVGSKIYVPDRTPSKERTAVAKADKSTSSVVKENQVAGGEVPAGAAKYYIVQSGDSLFTIARRYGTTIDELKKVNQISRGKLLKVGAKLKLPGEEGTSAVGEPSNNPSKKKIIDSSSRFARTRVHIVRRGENLSKIAQRYRVGLDDLRKRNHLRLPSNVLIGSKLVIPPSTEKD